ncbi:MAG: FAD-dependent oxidoreductase [Planctomycetes bacterium]|jgi:NADH dehydrogenase|nr:FAD-dependent oxidoreductase [Planctomycetota bacterium]
MKRRVIIVGGGFAGIFAMRRLRLSRRRLEVIVIDQRPSAHFLPLLPDMISRPIAPASVMHDLRAECRRWDAMFLHDEVAAVDVPGVAVITRGLGRLSADAIVLSCGTSTAFHGRDDLRPAVMKLDDVGDAVEIAARARSAHWKTALVVGGGYTGVEVATHLRRLENLRRSRRRIIILELAPVLLPGMPRPLSEYAAANLMRMRIEVMNNRTLRDVIDQDAILSDESVFKNVLIVWSAGVKTPAFLSRLNLGHDRQGRLDVDKHLQAAPGVFVAGDAAGRIGGGAALRMGVQFSISGGRRAAANILRSLDGRALKPFEPMDPGYVIPMANMRSCGEILGVSAYGLAPSMMHYLMSVYRTFGAKRLKLLGDILRRR